MIKKVTDHWRIYILNFTGARPPTPRDPILSFLHTTFSPKSAHIEGQRPPKTGPRPPPQEILDPPLLMIVKGIHTWHVNDCHCSDINKYASRHETQSKYTSRGDQTGKRTKKKKKRMATVWHSFPKYQSL